MRMDRRLYRGWFPFSLFAQQIDAAGAFFAPCPINSRCQPAAETRQQEHAIVQSRNGQGSYFDELSRLRIADANGRAIGQDEIARVESRVDVAGESSDRTAVAIGSSADDEWKDVFQKHDSDLKIHGGEKLLRSTTKSANRSVTSR